MRQSDGRPRWSDATNGIAVFAVDQKDPGRGRRFDDFAPRMNVSSLSRHIDVLPVTGKIAAETDKALRRPTRTSTRPVGGGAARSNAAWQASTASNWTPRRPIRDR